MKKQMHFGEHLTLDCYGGIMERLNDPCLVEEFLSDLVDDLGMKKLSPVKVFFAQGNGGKDTGGWSGFVVIEESHISIHTFPHRRFASIDVYTCQNGLNKTLIKKYTKTTIQL